MSSEEYENLLAIEQDRWPRQEPVVDKRKRKRKERTLLGDLQDMMGAASEIIDNHMSPIEDGILGTTDSKGNNLQCATQHYEHCQHEGTPLCANIETAPILCFMCQRSFCRDHALQNQTTNVIVLGANNPMLDSGDDGGHILCKECGSIEELNNERVINIDVIAMNTIPQVNGGLEDLVNAVQYDLINSSKYKGTDGETLTGADIRAPYLQKSTDRPRHKESGMDHEVNVIPPLIPTKQPRVYKCSWLKRIMEAGGDSDDGMCPGGCGDVGCKMTSTLCQKQFPYGDRAWEIVKQKRTQVKHYLENGQIDRAWEYVMHHITYDEHWKNKKANNNIRVFENIEVDPEKVEERIALGINCSFCKRATPENGLLKVEEQEIGKHERRGIHACGPVMWNAGLSCLMTHGAKTQATARLSGPPGSLAVPVKFPFFRRLFGLAERTLRTHCALKKKGITRSDIQEKRAKAGGSNRITPLQDSRLVDILKHTAFPQTLPHYAPASSNHIYRYAPGTSKHDFWWKYCELWDRDFYNQCNRLKHKQGFDHHTARPSDEIYLQDAKDYFGVETVEAVQEVYDNRKVVRDEIKRLVTRMTADVDDDEQGDEGEEDGDEDLAARVAELELKLKRMRGCHVRADVSYTTAIRVYKRYAIKTGIVAADTCKNCDSLKMKIRYASGTAKKKLEKELKEHHDMAEEGYKWRAQDRTTSMESNSKVYTMIIDFGQGLRTPTLSFGAAWYRRVLKVYPYIICGYGKDGFKDVTYYVWDETIAKKGADEVISCVHRNIMSFLPDDAEHLIIHFDGCFGQAANCPFMCFCADLLDPSSPFYLEQLVRITLKRNPVGHTFCDCDTCHGKTQSTLRKNMGGQVHTMEKLDGAPEGLVSWEEVITSAGFNCVLVTQKDVLDYTKYLMTKMYKKPSKAVAGTSSARKKWLISEQHITHLGRRDRPVGPERENEQETRSGFVWTAKTWNQEQQSLVRIWREKDPKITVDNRATVRQTMLEHLDVATQLPNQKYTELFTLCVRKKWDNWMNGLDSGFGPFLSVRKYFPLTDDEKTERTKLIKASVDARNNDEYEDEDED